MENDNNTPWQYNPNGDDSDLDDSAPAEAPAKKNTASFSWQSVEFIEHPHGAAWFGALALITAALTVLIYIMTRDYVATGVIPVVGVIVGVFAKHKPGMVEYEISGSGLKVGERSYPYSSFKSFSILEEGGMSSVNLFPLKRFSPPVAAYFEPAQREKIVGVIGESLPYEEHKLDSVERLTRRLHL